MAKNQTKRLAPAKLEGDENGFAALQKIQDYSPINPAYVLEAVAAVRSELHHLRNVAIETAARASAAREHARAKEWEFHNLMLGVKEQVIAQFGKDSNEVQMMGLKRKSEYKSPKRKPSSNEPSP